MRDRSMWWLLTPDVDTIVGTIVVGVVTEEGEWNSTIDAFSIGVILTRACLPAAVIDDVVLPRWVLVAQLPGRHGRDWVFAVGDAGKHVQIAINEIGELLVPDLKES